MSVSVSFAERALDSVGPFEQKNVERTKESESSEQTTRTWVKYAKIDDGRRSDGPMTVQREDHVGFMSNYTG